ncbi:EamA family transporter [Candidatus Saccharibacteria bacterium]|nr:EamA family transporter [Candidatus Saccharibacteria bacterium]
MNWIIFIAINIISASMAIFIDNYVTDFYFKGREANSVKTLSGFAYVIYAIVMALIFGINFQDADVLSIILIFSTGIISSIGSIPYLKALECDDSINLGIFIQSAPVLYLILGWFLLGESFSPLQLVSFAIILSAPVIILLNTRKRSRKVRLKAIMYASLFIITYVASALIFVMENGSGLNLTSSLAIVLFGKGIGNILIVAFKPKWRKRFRHVVKESKNKALIPITINTVVAVVADFSYRIGLATAPTVAFASAISDTGEPIAIFFLGLVLTLIWPKFGREKLDRKTVRVHLIATVLVVIGIIIMQVQI